MAITHLRSGKPGVLEHRASSDGEVRSAVRAPVGHAGVRRRRRSEATAVPAVPLAVPEHLLEPLAGSGFVWEHVHQLDNRDTFAVGFAWGFVSLHGSNMIHRS